MRQNLLSLGYFICPAAGATPFRILPGRILFEIVTAGAVYDLSDDTLCPAGWIFVHQEGDETIWKTPPYTNYECFTAMFSHPNPQDTSWPTRFFWESARDRNTFCHEMLHSFHHAEMDRDILGSMVWSQFRYRLECFRQQSSSQDIPPRVKRVMSYIETHYDQDLSVQDLADLVSLSASHLHARFKEWTGMTPHQYLISQRMREARHRLVTTTDPIKAIADQIGYANTENFCRAFKQHFQSTAATYRRNYTIYP